MNLTSTETRNKSFYEEVDKPNNLLTKREMIFKIIKQARKPLCRSKIQEILGWDHNKVAPRLTELENEEVLITQDENYFDEKTEKTVVTYRAFKDPEERMEAIYTKRKEAKAKLEDLINDYLDGKLREHTFQMVEKEKSRIEKYIKKLDQL